MNEHERARLQAVGYWQNFANSLNLIRSKIILLSVETDSRIYQAEHRKLIKLLTRATTNLRLFKQRLFEIGDLATEEKQEVERLNLQLTHYTQKFFMRSSLPENALNALDNLPLDTVEKILNSFNKMI